MPTSFSRILNEEDLAEVRTQYLAALDALEEDEAGAEPAEDTGEDTSKDEEAGREGD